MLVNKILIEGYIQILTIFYVYGFMFSALKSNAQGIIINSGNLVTDGSTYLVIVDGSFTNNATFVGGNSYLLFAGTAITSKSFIGGSSSSSFNNITINKSAYGVQLNSDITLNGNLYMKSDSLDLNGHSINMGLNANIIGENANSQITGMAGGKINLLVNLNAPQNANPGNIGVGITSSSNLGITRIERGHIQQNTLIGGKSIFRYYDIKPAQNAGLNATLKFYYTDTELAGLNKTDLKMYSSADSGTSWTLLGRDKDDASNNSVIKNGINHFGRFTLANSIKSALPVKLINFICRYINYVTVLQWQTASEQNGSYFNILRSIDGRNFSNIGSVRSTGSSNLNNNYSFIDKDASYLGVSKAFYRLEQVDIDNKKDLSKIIAIDILLFKELIVISPNPVKEILHIRFNSLIFKKGDYLVVTDLNGRNIMTTQIPVNSTSIELLLSGLLKGVYWLLMHNGPHVYCEKFVKI